MIRLQAITKTYGGVGGAAPVDVLKGIDLHVRANEFVGILGASGSGKSTLLKIIGLMHRATSGTLEFNGRDLSHANERELTRARGSEVGFVFQSFQLIGHLTVLENVELPLFYQRVSKRERRKRAHEILERVGLGHRHDHVPNELSGGECQRTAVARALVSRPAVLLADEPTGNLDVKTGESIIQLFNELHDAGTTIVLITHDEGLARRIPRVIRLSDGRVVLAPAKLEGKGIAAGESLQPTASDISGLPKSS